ncbi:acetyl-coenzyme A synthetase N-terminal domain-containing protein, partial [Alcaligenes pakistanensis]
MSGPTSIESVLSESRVFPVFPTLERDARIAGMAAYQELCQKAEQDNPGYWAELARDRLVWTKPFTQALDDSNPPFYKWFHDGELNVSANCLDKHLGTPTEHKTALIFEADGGEVTKVTFRELYEQVCQFANGLKALGHKTGERALIYMPMSVQAIVAMQACARLGITHSVVFGGFSAKSLHERAVDVGA